MGNAQVDRAVDARADPWFITSFPPLFHSVQGTVAAHLLPAHTSGPLLPKLGLHLIKELRPQAVSGWSGPRRGLADQKGTCTGCGRAQGRPGRAGRWRGSACHRHVQRVSGADSLVSLDHAQTVPLPCEGIMGALAGINGTVAHPTSPQITAGRGLMAWWYVMSREALYGRVADTVLTGSRLSRASLHLAPVSREDPAMTLPAGWRVIPGSKTFTSGQSWVYQVRKAGDTAVYALKRLRDPDRRARFAREVTEVMRLREQGLALPPIIEADLEIERPYFVMPWYERGSLEAKVQDGTYVDRTLDGLDLLISIARELRKLHSADVAHRDLKPANVLLGYDGPLLADFGLCLPIASTDERLTATAEAIGSRFYIAPENESGINEERDQRPADFYAFGKMAWALLAGRSPFARELAGNPDLRLQAIRGDQRFAVLDNLLDDLMNSDVRARLVNWDLVIDELAAFQSVLRGTPAPPKPRTLDETLRLARRVGRLPPLQAASQQRQNENRLNEWINGQLIGSLTLLAGDIQEKLTALTSAADGAVSFHIDRGGPSLSDLLSVEDRFRWPEYDQASVVPNQPSGAAVLYMIQPLPAPGISPLHLGTYFARMGQEFWVVRIPFVAGAVLMTPDSMIHRYYNRIGPLPVGRQTAFDRVTQFCRQTMDLFLDMAHRYLAAVSEGTDPLDASVWESAESPTDE
jgi:serine/threonine protein kinase